MSFFVILFEFLREQWGVGLLLDVLVFCGLAAYHKTWGWIGAFMLLFAVCCMAATLGSVMALNAATPGNLWGDPQVQAFFAKIGASRDYTSTWTDVFGLIVALGSLMLYAAVLFPIGWYLLSRR